MPLPNIGETSRPADLSRRFFKRVFGRALICISRARDTKTTDEVIEMRLRRRLYCELAAAPFVDELLGRHRAQVTCRGPPLHRKILGLGVVEHDGGGGLFGVELERVMPISSAPIGLRAASGPRD